MPVDDTAGAYRPNLPLFFAFQFVWHSQLFLPIWVIFLQQVRGFSLAQVAFIDAAFWATIVLSEIPTGAVADTFGRRVSLLLGVLLSALSITMFALAPTFGWLMVANSLWALALTFESGAAQAFLHDTLEALGRSQEYARQRGRLLITMHISIAAGSLLGGVIGARNLAAPFLLYSAALLPAAILVLLLKEPPREANAGGGASYRSILKTAATAVRGDPLLRGPLLYSAVLPLASLIAGVVFLQPHALSLGVPIAAMGVLALGLRAFQMTGAAASNRIFERIGLWTWLPIAPLLVATGVVAMGLIPSLWGLAFFALTGLATSATVPMLEAVILRQAPRQVRATLLSFDSLLFHLLLTLLEPGLGLLADARGLPNALVALGLIVLIGTTLAWIGWRRAVSRSVSMQSSS